MSVDAKRNSNAQPVELARFGSIAEMSAQTGIPQEILKAAKRDGCKFVRHGRPDLFEFLRWYFTQELSGEERENWGRRDKRAQALTREHRLELARRSVIEFDAVSQFIAKINNAFFSEIERMENEFPPNMKAKSEIEILEYIKGFAKGMVERLKAKAEEWQGLKQGAPDDE